MGAARRVRAAAVRRGQSDADQILPVAAGPDRLARVPPAVDEYFRRAGEAAGYGYRAFSRSRISVSRTTSCEGGAGGGGVACSFFSRRFMPRTTMNITKATMMKLIDTVMNVP